MRELRFDEIDYVSGGGNVTGGLVGVGLSASGGVAGSMIGSTLATAAAMALQVVATGLVQCYKMIVSQQSSI